MNKPLRIFITFASWEDRFTLGCKRLFEQSRFDRAIVFFLDSFASWTVDSRNAVNELCVASSVKANFVELYADEAGDSWNKQLLPTFSELNRGDEVVVDISTMPRETIWQTFWFLRLRSCSIKYIYNRPASYGDWLSRDPDKPRLVYKLSGISRFGARTALVVLAGYDVDRVRHLVETFEPEVTFLGLQKDSIDPRNTSQMQEQIDEFEGDNTVKQFWIDAYAPQHGYEEIRKQLVIVSDTHNVVMASMGPKLSAVSLFNLHSDNDTLGLAYLPAREFNREYSSGIGESIVGSLP